jgi:hypothetical protein
VCFDLAPEEMETADERESTWFDALAPWWSDGTVGDAAPMPEPEPELQAGAEAGRVVMQYYGGEELEENVYSSCECLAPPHSSDLDLNPSVLSFPPMEIRPLRGEGGQLY